MTSKSENTNPGWHRKTIRIPGYDYASPGGYFITICSFISKYRFGEIINGEMEINTLGSIIREEWFKSAVLRKNIELHEDEFVIMPDHIHGIIWIVGSHQQSFESPVSNFPKQFHLIEKFGKPLPGSIPTIVRAFKSSVTLRARKELGIPKVWQRNYYEHILRDQEDLEIHQAYILANPLRWEEDELIK